MKKSLLFKLAMLLLTVSTLSGCFWRVEDHETGPADYHDRDHGDHHGEHNDDHGDHR